MTSDEALPVPLGGSDELRAAYSAGYRAADEFLIMLDELMAKAWVRSRKSVHYWLRCRRGTADYYMMCNDTYLQGLHDALTQIFAMPVVVDSPVRDSRLHIRVIQPTLWARYTSRFRHG